MSLTRAILVVIVSQVNVYFVMVIIEPDHPNSPSAGDRTKIACVGMQFPFLVRTRRLGDVV